MNGQRVTCTEPSGPSNATNLTHSEDWKGLSGRIATYRPFRLDVRQRGYAGICVIYEGKASSRNGAQASKKGAQESSHHPSRLHLPILWSFCIAVLGAFTLQVLHAFSVYRSVPRKAQ